MIPPPVFGAKRRFAWRRTGDAPARPDASSRRAGAAHRQVGGRVSVVLLAGGYGTRLYPLTTHCPKALLPLHGGVVLDVIVETLRSIEGLSRIVLVTNHRFLKQFRAWHATRAVNLKIVDDGSTTPETRRGALPDLLLGLDQVGPRDDVLVLGTDNLFTWSLAKFVAFAKTKRPAATVALRKASSLQVARRCGVVKLDRHGRVTECVEKPQHPPSLIIGLCVYYFPVPSRQRIREFVKRRAANLDAPGYFLEWLVTREPVYGCMTRGAWFDIGSPDAYHHVVRWWGRRRKPTVNRKRVTVA